MKAQILESCHDNVGGCHLGRDKTVDKVVSIGKVLAKIRRNG